MSVLGWSFRALLRSGGWLIVALPMILLLWMLVDGVRPHPESFAGLPRAQSIRPWPWHSHWFHVIDPPGFVLGYSERWGNPLWVAYRLDDRIGARNTERPDHFREDPWTLMRVSADDYTRSGYDRGHMAPNYAMSRFEGRQAQLASFRMSNIVPQKPALNRKLWQRLEEIEADVYAAKPGPLWVTMGPIFGDSPQRLAGKVAVPEAYYRIWLREDESGQAEVLAFLVPQVVRGDEPLNLFVVSVDEIEEASGLDFFHNLPDEQEDELEARKDPGGWNFYRYARRPSRY